MSVRKPGQGQLQLRENDLPPRWDGELVLWQGWQSELEAVAMCPPPRSPIRCTVCRSTAAPLSNRGLIWHGMSAVERRLPRAPDAMLVAFRCPGCEHDHVLDGFGPSAQAWDLDPSDYSDDGSRWP